MATMKTTTEMTPQVHDKEDGRSPIPYPNPGWMRLVSIALAIGLSVLILVYPRVVATSVSEVNHGLLTLLMWGIASGFVHGVGFVPRLTIWRGVFHRNTIPMFVLNPSPVF